MILLRATLCVWAVVSQASAFVNYPVPPLIPSLVVNFMNTARRQVSPPGTNLHEMEWSMELAMMAQNHSNKCTLRKAKAVWIPSCDSVGQVVHSTPISMVENTGTYVLSVLQAWKSRGSNYDYIQNVCTNSVDCRAYTQMVWADTWQVGCGVSVCEETSRYFIVCFFSPGGNVFGLRPYDTLMGAMGTSMEIPVSCSGCSKYEECGDLDLCVCRNSTNMKCACPDPFEEDPEPEMAMGSDPHFNLRLTSGQQICFTVKGESGSYFNLISTGALDINALFITLDKNPNKTWLGAIGVSVANGRKIVFNSSSKSVIIDHTMKLPANKIQKVRLSAQRFYLTMTTDTSNKHVLVEIQELGLRFSVVYIGRQHLDLLWLSGKVSSKSIHGLLGQFLQPGVKMNEANEMLSIPGREKPQPMRQRKLFSFLHADAPQLFDKDQLCWTTKKPSQQGVGLIEGSYLDYKVSNITSNGFKFTAEH